MNEILHQQRLFLELVVMSGNIALPAKDNGTILYVTMKECEKLGWVTLSPFGEGFKQAKITATGRLQVRDRRIGQRGNGQEERRRTLEDR